MREELYKLNIAMLEKYYNHKLDDILFKVYYKALKNLNDDKFLKSISGIMTSDFRPTQKNPFPLIGDFIKHSGESIEDRAINVVRHVRKAISKHGAYESINFGDTAIHSVIGGYGGWIKICGWTDENWIMKETAFINSYKSALKTNTNDCAYLAGIHELNNIGRYPVEKPKQFLLNGYNNTIEIENKSNNIQIEDLSKKIIDKFSLE